MATFETQDIMPVRSRVSWGAIVAGAVVALAVYLLVSALGVAIGLSVNTDVGARELGIAAAIWAVVTTLFALFLGGWVASQCTVGETRMEAAVYGVLTWGVVFTMLLWMMAGGVRMGFNALMGLATSPAATAASRLTDEDLRAAGFTQDQISDMRTQFNQLGVRAQNAPEEARAIVHDPRTTAAAWWTFGGILLSMLAAVGGALIGAGPNMYMTAFQVRAVTGRQQEYQSPVRS